MTQPRGESPTTSAAPAKPAAKPESSDRPTTAAAAAAARAPTAPAAPAPTKPAPTTPAAAPAPAPAAFAPDAVDLVRLPSPDDVRGRDPDAPAPPPGHVPVGDSRSLRRRTGTGERFALVYRDGTFLMSRSGAVGREGTWHVVEYPTAAAAAHAYATTCARLTEDGFTDYR
jgi:hypothetical protein